MDRRLGDFSTWAGATNEADLPNVSSCHLAPSRGTTFTKRSLDRSHWWEHWLTTIPKRRPLERTSVDLARSPGRCHDRRRLEESSSGMGSESGARQPQVLIDRVEHRADTLFVPLVAGRPVEAQGHDEPPLRVREAGGGAVAAVAEGAGRGVVAVAVGHRLLAVPRGVDDEAQSPIQDVLEGRVH